MGYSKQDCNCNNRGYNRMPGNRYRQPVKDRCGDIEDIIDECKEEKCGYEDIDSFPLAMAYVPWQCWNEVFDAHRGLEEGTIFPELVKPFLGAKCGCKM